MANRKGYSAVVESGSCDQSYTYWEERMNCGHLHKTIEAAEKCGAEHYNAHYENGSWTASAAWHGYKVHDQDGLRAVDMMGVANRQFPTAEELAEMDAEMKADQAAFERMVEREHSAGKL